MKIADLQVKKYIQEKTVNIHSLNKYGNFVVLQFIFTLRNKHQIFYKQKLHKKSTRLIFKIKNNNIAVIHS